jgi:DNA invertase Pin-like site-specific DNA recombinase
VTIRCAIYARYSSDQQREASIEDQIRICRARAEREGWTVVEVLTDAAVSGSTTLRPGYQALLQAMRGGGIEVVLAESLDRFSRDQEHIAAFYKHASFAGVQVVTLAEGQITELHIGLKGTMGALFLKDLADKTRRGLEGRIRAGRSAGAAPYGYRVVRQLGPDGEVVRGLREPDPAEAGVVRRIFEDYAAGRSPRAIAKGLNEEGVPGPGGGPWFASTIRGRPARGCGLLRNPVYIGRLVWNRSRTLKDPVTGRIRRRRNVLDSLVETEVPALRLVTDELWARVQARLADAAAETIAERSVAAFWDRRRPKHLLTGKVVCGVCGGLFQPRGRDYLGCTAAHRYLCRNTTTVRRTKLQARVLEALGRQLMHPDLLAAFAAEFTREWNRLAAEQTASRAAAVQALEAVERQIGNLVDAIADGLRSPGLQAKFDALEAKRAALTASLAEEPAPAPALHPNLAEVYRARVATLERALAAKDAPEALEAARDLIDRVIIHPPGGPDEPPGIELVGQLMNMLRAAGARLPTEDASFAEAVLDVFTRSAKAGPGGQRPPRHARLHPARALTPHQSAMKAAIVSVQVFRSASDVRSSKPCAPSPFGP